MDKKSLTFFPKFLFIFFLSLDFGYVFAQGTFQDYQRASILKQELQKVYFAPASFTWASDGSFFWYTVKTPSGNEFLKFEANTGKKSKLFEADLLAMEMKSAGLKINDSKDLNVTVLEFDPVGNIVKFRYEGFNWTYRITENDLVKGERLQENARAYWGRSPDERSGSSVKSPDSVTVAFIKDNNVFLRKNGKENQVTFDGSPGQFYAADIKWAPDGKKLAVLKVRPAEIRKLTLLESSPKDQLQPILHVRDYRKPGDALPVRIPVLLDLEKDRNHEVPIEMIPDQYAIQRLSWRKDSRAFTFEYNQRGHQEYTVYDFRATGEIVPLIQEKSSTFIDYSGKYFRKDINDGNEIIWSSERDGWRHLYLVDGTNGKIKNQITKGEWVVRNVIHTDEEKRKIYFLASGVNPGEDPYHTHLCTVNFDGSDFKVHTFGDANFDILFSPDYTHYIATYSRQDLAPVSKLFSLKDEAKELFTIEEADISALRAVGWSAPERFSTKGRDGLTEIWGHIIKPSNFDPSIKYPVIEYIYAGPHSSHVPKTFRPNYGGLNELAELGFIVVQIDGMGTSNRSKAFHDVCYQNLKDAGFPDRKIWIKDAAASRPYIDLERVGIFGTSAGGQNSAGALVFHNDFYKVAVSSCGCHDNRMDKIWWNEQWMGKIGPHYEACSNTANADKLQGKLMLIVGELDDNVDPASTFQFADALIREMKDFEMIYVPGMGHSSGGEYGERKRRDFFVKNLLGVEPPKWN